MKKSVMRVFSVLLALVMLLGMTATAEVNRITFDLNGFDGTKLDGILSIGFDEDGCEQYSFANSMLGKFVLQSDGNDLVFGGDQIGYYAVSADDLAEAITTIVSMIVSQQMGSEMMDMMNYFNSPAYQQDAAMLADILAYEVNRLASFAGGMGLVVIHENGDLEIAMSIDKVFTLISEYLKSLAADTAVLNAFANLEIFKVLGVPMAQNAGQLPALLNEVASGVEAALAEAKSEMDGGLELYVSAETGVMTGKYYTSTISGGRVVYAMTETFTVSENGMKMDVVVNPEGGEVRMTYEANDNGVSYALTADAAGQNASLACKLDASGFVCEAYADTNTLSGEGKIVVDANGIDGKWDFAGSDLTFNGAIDFDPAMGELTGKVNYANANESLKASIEFVDGELYAEMTQIVRGQITSNFTISGSGTYRIKGNWVEYGTNYALNATLRMKNSGPELEGEVQVGNDTTHAFYYGYDASKSCTTFFLSTTEGKNKNAIELNLYNTGYGNRVSVLYTEKTGSNTATLNASVETDGLTGDVSGEFSIDQGYGKQSGTFQITEDLFEIKFSDGEMTYRIYAEAAETNTGATVKAGMSGAMLSDPANVMDAILFVMNVNNNMTFDAVLNTMMGYYAAAGFDGQSLKLDVTANGNTITLEGKMVQTGNAQYVEFTGFVSGAPIEARIGLKMEDAATTCLFAEALIGGEKMLDVELHIVQAGNEVAIELLGDSVVIDGVKAVLRAGATIESNETVRFFAEAIGDQPGYKLGAYLPVTIIENANGASVSAKLSVAQGDQEMEIGNVYASYETVYENLDHVDGERLTSDMLVEMILSLLGAY